MKYLFPISIAIFVAINIASKTPSIQPYKPPTSVINTGSGLLAFPRFQNISSNTEKAPLILVFHGRGGSYKSDLQKIIPTNLKARVFFMQGHIKNPAGGYLFFEPRLAEPDIKVTEGIKKQEQIIINGLQYLKKTFPHNKVIAFGFSQGAAVALYLGSLGLVDEVIAFSGSLPEGLYPNQKANTVMKMWHGINDTVVKETWGQNTANAFQEVGYNVTYLTDTKAHVLPPKNIVEEFLVI